MTGKDIDIVIGAKDQASSILRGLSAETKRVGSSVKNMAGMTTSATKTMGGAFAALKASAGPLIAVFAAFKAAQSGFAFLSGASSAAKDEEEAIRGLTNAIKSSGDVTGPSIAQHQEFASTLQSTFNIADDAALGLMKQASMLGVNNDQLQDVTRAAIGLSEATGISLESALGKVNQAINGNAKSLGKMLPEIKSAATEEERLAIVMQASERGLAQKAERAKSAGSAGERLALAWGDFQETIGLALEPVRQFIAGGLEVLVETIHTAVIPAIQSMMPSAETMASVMTKMRDAIVKAVTFVEVVVGNLGPIWEIAKASATLQIIGMVEAVKYAFTVEIPAYASWFGRNFFNLIRDALALTKTVVVNFATTAGDVFTKMWRFIASGGEEGAVDLAVSIAKASATSFTQGFEAQTESLPQLLGRQLTDGERDLMAQITGLTGDIATEYSTKLAKRMAQAGQDAGQELLTGINLGAGGTGKEGSIGELIEKKTSSSMQALTAVQSRLLSRGPGSNPMLEETRKVTQGINQLTKVTEIVAKNTETKQKPGFDLVEVGIA
jgi:hypothetical protein